MRTLVTASITWLCVVGLSATPALAGSGTTPATPRVTAGEGTRTPVMVDGIRDAARGGDPVNAARAHLAANKSRYAIGDPGDDLVPLTTVSRGNTETVRFGQRYHGLPVLGAHYLVRMDQVSDKREVTGTGGRYFTELTVDTAPKVTEATALERARASVRNSVSGAWATAVPEPRAHSNGLVVLPSGSGVLAYHVTVSTADPVRRSPVLREVYVDAHAGFPVLNYDRVARVDGPGTEGTGVRLDGTQVPLQLYYNEFEETFQMRDYTRMYPTSGFTLTTWDARGVDLSQVLGQWPSGMSEFASPTPHFDGAATESGAVDAHWAAGQVYNFYRDRLGRDSLDGRGVEINSLVGVTIFGQPYVNAFWDGRKMVYGSGDAETKPLSADLDVVGHEMTHGVIEHSANLVYIGQSGAMNEAIADYFGNAIDVTVSGTEMSHPDAGLIGEDLCRTQGPRECALRDLNDGATISGDLLGVTTDWDNGGVHLNSTIFSGALWDIREWLDPELADRIVYTALTEYMTPLDGFTDGRRAVIAAAMELGLNKRLMRMVLYAFDSHGIVPDWERKIGVDSTRLFGDVTTTRTGTDAAGGWWVASNSNHVGDEPYSVYAGRTDGKGQPIRLSPNDGRYHVYPATDGETVVWAAFGPTNVQILARPLDGGLTQVVGTTTGNVQFPVVFDGTFAFQISHPRGGTHVMVKRPEDARSWLVDGGAPSVTTAMPTLHGGRLAYLKIWWDRGSHIAPEIMDVATRELTTLPPTEQIGEYLPRLGRPVLTGEHLFWLVDQYADDGQAGVWRANLDGSGGHAIVAETGSSAPIPSDLDATDQAVTFDTWASAELTNANLPKIFQVDVDGRKVERVSCNRGAQMWYSADTRTRVVWLDGTTGRTGLVTRAHPARHCKAGVGWPFKK